MHRVTSLVTSRCLAFLAQILNNVNPRNLAVPQPLVVLQVITMTVCLITITTWLITSVRSITPASLLVITITTCLITSVCTITTCLSTYV